MIIIQFIALIIAIWSTLVNLEIIIDKERVSLTKCLIQVISTVLFIIEI